MQMFDKNFQSFKASSSASAVEIFSSPNYIEIMLYPNNRVH